MKLTCILTAAGVSAADLLIKEKIDRTPDQSFPRELTPGVRLMKHHNYGFAWGKMKEDPKKVKLIAGLCSIPLLIVSALSLSGRAEGNATEQTGLFLLAGGAFSNLFDRFRKGFVVDYVNFPKAPKRIRTLIFNLGDFALFLGAILYPIGAIFSKK